MVSDVEPASAVEDGIPGPAALPPRVTSTRRRSLPGPVPPFLLQLRVQPGGAIDIPASEVEPPAPLAAGLRFPDVYLVPAGWLEHSTIVRALAVDPAGRVTSGPDLANAPVHLLSRGAAHGVPGLPDEVQRWPSGRRNITAGRYILVSATMPDGLGRWQRLHRQQPAAMAGHRLVEVTIERDRAIDVAATARALVGLTRVRTILSRLTVDGIDMLLPVASYPHVRIVREFVPERGKWRRLPAPTAKTLEEWPTGPDTLAAVRDGRPPPLAPRPGTGTYDSRRPPGP